VADVMTAKAYALREGLLLAQYMGCNQFTVQSNNTEVVQTMNDGGFSATAATAIFYDCNLLASGFSKVNFEYCPREANIVAHELAKSSFQSSSSSCTWDDDPPSFIFPFLINDISVFDYQ
jgi:hypothetical protein